MRRWGPLVAAVVTALSVSASAYAAVMIGNASTVVREVKSALETRERVLIVDDDVFQDEEVTTGALSAARLIFKDGTNMSIGAQSRLKLTRVLFDPDPSKSKVAMRAAVGVFRMATGTLPSSAYQVATPVATISVRGTIIEFTVTGTGTTTVYVAKGAATVRSNNGDEVDLEAGQSTTVRAEGSDGGDILAMSPTPPETPGDDFSKQMRAMTVNIRSEEPQIDMIPGGGGFNNGPRGGFPFPSPPPRSNFPSHGGGKGGIGSPGLGGGGGGNPPQNNNQGNGGGTNPPGNSPGGNGGNGGTGDGLTFKAQGPAFARAGTMTESTIIIARVGDGAEAIVGTLDALSGNYKGSGGSASLGAGQSAAYTYQFTAPALVANAANAKAAGNPNTYTANVGYNFPGHVNGTIQLSTTVVGPVLRIDGATEDTISVPHSMGASPFSYNIRIVNDALSGHELALVGLSILNATITGAGSNLFSLSFADENGDGVLDAGEEGFFTLTFDPDAGGNNRMARSLLAEGELTLSILTDVNALFGHDGELFQYRFTFIEDLVIAEPGIGLAVLLFGGIVVFHRPRRQRR